MKSKLKISIVTLMLLMIGQGASAWDGLGTEGAPYQISTIAELNELAANVKGGNSYEGKYFKLMNHLNYSGEPLTDGCNFTPIGWGDNELGKPFAGHFDGNGKTISGITYVKADEWGVGVFGYISHATIKNLTVANSSFTANGFVGGICGGSHRVSTDNPPTIQNCHVASTVSLEVKDYAVGGIIGITSDNVTITACTSAAVLTSTDTGIGGVVGVVFDDASYMATITDSYYIGEAALPAIGINGGTYKATINITLLSDDSGATVKNPKRISNYNDMRANVTLDGRTLYKDDKWNTLCLPFNVTAEQIAISTHPLYGATLKDLDITGWYDGDYVRYGEKADGRRQTGFDTSDGTLYLYFKDASTITAGKPFLIKWTSGSNISNPVFSNVVINNADPDDPDVKAISNDKAVYFVGTYSQKNYPTANPNNFFLGAANTLYYPVAGASIGAMRAYFVYDPDAPAPGPSSIKQFVLNFGEDSTTGVESVQVSSFKVQDSEIFNLAGQRMNRLQKGINIVNGKKVIIKK